MIINGLKRKTLTMLSFNYEKESKLSKLAKLNSALNHVLLSLLGCRAELRFLKISTK